MVAFERELPEPLSPAVSMPSADAIPLTLRRRGGSARQVLGLTCLGVLALALFASRDLPSWSERLGGSAAGLAAQELAVKWDDAMARFGLTRPHERLRELIRRWLDAQW